MWTRVSPGLPGFTVYSRFFGRVMASGDFDGDHFSDLAIGASGYGNSPGEVFVIRGSSTGLTSAGVKQWLQTDLGTSPGLDFGASLTAANFGKGPQDDLVIGVPDSYVNGASDAGAVYVLYGSPGGLAKPADFWHQGRGDQFGQVQNYPQDDDEFGRATAAGDFDGDGYADLAIAAPRENYANAPASGVVHVLRGSSNGLTTLGNQLWAQIGLEIFADAVGDRFGSSLSAFNAGGTAHADLLIGLPYDDPHGQAEGGSAILLYGSTGGLTSTGWRRFAQEPLDASEAGDRFGTVLP
jgi:hypothetical protein